MSTVQKTFLSSPNFAVVGASKDATKYGTKASNRLSTPLLKVLKWYQARNLDVIPVHPKEAELEGLATLRSIKELEAPKETSVSVITPPKVTLGVLELAKELGIPALWLQPGAEDDAVVKYIKDNELTERVIYGGPCILVEGDGIRQSLL